MSRYQEQRTWIGKAMFNITVRCGGFLSRHMWLYYVLNYTWGIIMTLVGWIAYLFARLFLRRKIVEVGRFGPSHYVMLGDNWGGLEMGTNFFLADNMGDLWTLHTKQHEMGHTFQNAIFGPFTIFLVFLPSAIRYWYRRLTKGEKKDYDAIWFEGSASTVGKNCYETFPERFTDRAKMEL